VLPTRSHVPPAVRPLYDTDGVKGRTTTRRDQKFLVQWACMSEKPLDIELAVLQGTFDARDDAIEELGAVLARYVVLTRHEAGCRNVDLLASTTQRGRFSVIEKWERPELVRSHLDSPLMVDMAREVVPLLAAKPTFDLYDGISAHDIV
jgi:quinol monooxygenase YgiN